MELTKEELKKVIFALEREQEYERWDPHQDYAEADCPYEWHEITALITKFKTYLEGGENNANL